MAPKRKREKKRQKGNKDYFRGEEIGIVLEEAAPTQEKKKL